VRAAELVGHRIRWTYDRIVNPRLVDMETFRERLLRWGQSRCEVVEVASLFARCPIAHKWKAPMRSLVVREALFWRMHDLGEQVLLLMEHGRILGARILLRSAIETLALLIYLNRKMKSVLDGDLSYFDFDDITKQLLMGSKNQATAIAAVNVLTVLKHADKDHPGILAMHEHLSESAHPNYDGVLYGYTNLDPEKFETTFANNWERRFGKEQEPGTAFVLAAFEHEYNVLWHQHMTDFEAWLRAHDDQLEAELRSRKTEGS